MSDILGQAISDYYYNRPMKKLWVHDDYGPNMEMPVAHYFRDEKKMPELELRALDLCKGKVLDIGAGAGSHALALQNRGFDVTALEISPLAAEVIKARGVKKVIQEDIFKYEGEVYDTLLLMMNGIGLSSTIEGLKRFLKKSKTLINPGGQLVFDSSDVAYLYEGEVMPMGYYYGEIKCRYEYKKEYSNWLIWLYIDPDYLQRIAHQLDFDCEIIFEDGHHQYLAQLTMK